MIVGVTVSTEIILVKCTVDVNTEVSVKDGGFLQDANNIISSYIEF